MRLSNFIKNEKGQGNVIIIALACGGFLIGFLMMAMMPVIATSVMLQGLGGVGQDVAKFAACNFVSKGAGKVASTVGSPFGLGGIDDTQEGFCDLMDALDESGVNKQIKIAFDCNTQDASQEAISGETCEDGSMGYMDETSTAIPKQSQWLIPIYQKAAKKYNLPWQLLAAINQQETNFGMNDGYRRDNGYDVWGWMQFQTPTWNGIKEDAGSVGGVHHDGSQPCPVLKSRTLSFKKDGKADRCDPIDAIFTAAKLLKSNGAKGTTWKFKGCPNDPISKSVGRYYGACGDGNADYVNEVHEKYKKIVAGTKKTGKSSDYEEGGTTPGKVSFAEAPGKVYTASTFGGTPGDDNGVGYEGDNLRSRKNWDTFAELSNSGTLDYKAMGGLKYKTKVLVTYPNGKQQILVKRDIGKGGPGLNGHKRGIDIGHQAITRAGYSKVSFMRNVKVKILGRDDNTSINNAGETSTASKEDICNPAKWKPAGQPIKPNSKKKPQPTKTKYYTSDGTPGRTDVQEGNFAIARMWKTCFPSYPIANAFFNDMDAPGHASHHNGADQDINYINGPGGAVTDMTGNGVYNSKRARLLASMFFRAGAVTILFNDKSLYSKFSGKVDWATRGSMVYAFNHDNHFHVRWYANNCADYRSAVAPNKCIKVYTNGLGSGDDSDSENNVIPPEPGSQLSWMFGMGF